VDSYRQSGVSLGVKSVRLDYPDILKAAENREEITVFCDLQGGIHQRPGNGALIFAGSPQHKFNLWIPDRLSPEAQKILNLIEKRYAGFGRGYVYVSGEIHFFRTDRPQIILESFSQLSDIAS